MKRLVAVLMLMPGGAFAQEVDCENAVSQMEMTYCAEQEWIAADADLNAAYRLARDAMRQIDSDLSAEQRGAEQYLKEAQLAWISFRDAACAAEGYLMHGGSAEPMVIYSCRARLTQQRAEDLWSLAEEY